MRRLRSTLSLFLFFLLLFSSVPVNVSAMDTLTLYARWQVQVTFDANGGTLSGGVTDAERAIAGQARGSITFNTNQSASTGLVGTKSGSIFLEWNTRSDGMGTSLSNYGVITGPVTFYAIYYQTDFYPSDSMQRFWAPFDGWYQIQCWGASGDNAHYGSRVAYGGRGGYTAGRVYLTKGTILSVRVETMGGGDRYYANNPGWAIVNGYGGGSASVGTNDSMYSRFIVAGGGGSAAIYGPYQRNGGVAGGLTGGNGSQMVWDANNGAFNASPPTGGTQTAGGRGYGDTGKNGGFGHRGSPGGGSGWWGGGYSGIANNVYSGGGGSSYASGFPGCAASSSGVTLTDPQLLSGNDLIMEPGGSMGTGHSGEAHARLVCVQQG